MLAIFDLDGTLLNSISDLAAASNHALKENGYPTHAPEAYPLFVGHGVTRLIERTIPEDQRTTENIERVRQSFTHYYDEHMTDLTEPYDGITDMLSSLNELGFQLAVASNKYQSAVERLIAHFFPYIPWAVVSGNTDDMPVKPDPSVIFSILNRCPTPKTQVIYAGDSGVDIDTARRAAVTSIGVTWGFRPESELTGHYADYIAHSPERIVRIAQAIKRGEPLL